MLGRRSFVGLLLASLCLPARGQEGGAFPVTVSHAFGETVIPARPQRILTIGWMAQDAVLALGEVPAAMPLQSWGGNADGVLPWVADALAARGLPLPQLLSFDDGPPIEQIAALGPDLILAPFSDMTEGQYRLLSALAPTIPPAERAWSGSWQAVTLQVGAALGRPQEAQKLVEGVGQHLAQTAAAHPSFAGKSFTFGYYQPSTSAVGVYVASDPRVQLLTDLGLVLSSGAAALPNDRGFYVDVSLELLESVDADVFITWHSSQAELDQFRANPLVQLFAPVRDGRHVGLVDQSFVMATSAPSVLSIPWALDRLVPELAAVLG